MISDTAGALLALTWDKITKKSTNYIIEEACLLQHDS
jgi:hypothetical protein